MKLSWTIGLAVCLAGRALPCQAQERPDVWIAEVVGPFAKVEGPLGLEDNRLLIGGGASLVSEGGPTFLKLLRGGSILVCPGAKVSLGGRGAGLMASVSSGGIEWAYNNLPVKDTILTPDFRIAIAANAPAGIAIDINSQGDTCVKAASMPGTSIVVTQLIDQASYTLKPEEQVLFRQGQLVRTPSDSGPPCGCPAVPLDRQEESPFSHSSQRDPRPIPQSENTEPRLPIPTPPTSRAAQVDVPVVFDGNKSSISTNVKVPPAPENVARADLRSLHLPQLVPLAAPPVVHEPLRNRSAGSKGGPLGILLKIKHLVAHVFRAG